MNMNKLRPVTSAEQLQYGKIIEPETGELLLPVIAVDAMRLATDGLKAVVMQGYANRLAVEKTLSKGVVTFWSRSQKGLWTKGATSGNFLNVRGAYTDCDSDSLLLDVDPMGPTCHTGADSCFEYSPQEVEQERLRKVIVLDMDGTLYNLVPDATRQKVGFPGSMLRRKVESNAQSFIQNRLPSVDSDSVMANGLADDIGISEYLQREFAIPRNEYFNTVWDIDPTDYVRREPGMTEAVQALAGGTFGSDKQKLVLMTAAPKKWMDRVLEYLDVSDAFETKYSGDDFKTKNDVFNRLAQDYNPANVLSVGDQLASDIEPARANGMQGYLVGSADDTVRLLKGLNGE